MNPNPSLMNYKYLIKRLKNLEKNINCKPDLETFIASRAVDTRVLGKRRVLERGVHCSVFKAV